MDKIQKLKYLLRAIKDFSQKKECPFCGSKQLKKIDRKYVFTYLLKCEKCGLQYRHPKDDDEFLRKFYQSDYDIDTAMMTKLPSLEEIEKLKEQNFSELRAYDKYLNNAHPKKNGLKVLDYGCSWGYNVYKLNKSGFDACGYELSVPRAKFGIDRLGVRIFTDEKLIKDNFDIVLSSHVIEHLHNIQNFILLAKKLLNKEGVFLAFCPNGSEAYRKREPKVFHVNWGFVHPNYLTIEFASFAFKNNPFLILTGDWDFASEEIQKWDGKSQIIGSRQDGKELLIIAKPNITIEQNKESI